MFYLYPVWIRIWHLVNALMFLILIITGISMQFANTESNSVIRFDMAVNIHNTCGIILTINYLVYLIANFVSGNFKYYKLELSTIKERLIRQAKYYTFGIFKNEPAPFPVNESRKFNPLQQFTYVMAMYLIVPLIFITGLGLIFPQILLTQLFGASGLFLTAIVHVIVTFLGTLFMLIHIYFCTIGATPVSNFKSMINGWHESH
jgi:thiosulfate reductase cytochrome b subunit